MASLSDGRLMSALEQEVMRMSGLPMKRLAIHRTFADSEFGFKMDFGLEGDVGHARTAEILIPEAEALYLGEAGIMELVILTLREAVANGDK